MLPEVSLIALQYESCNYYRHPEIVDTFILRCCNMYQTDALYETNTSLHKNVSTISDGRSNKLSSWILSDFGFSTGVTDCSRVDVVVRSVDSMALYTDIVVSCWSWQLSGFHTSKHAQVNTLTFPTLLSFLCLLSSRYSIWHWYHIPQHWQLK